MRIKEIRKMRGLTQEQLAEAAGMSRSHLAEIEGGKRPPNTRRMEAIAKVLRVAPADLFPLRKDDAGTEELVETFRRLSPEDRAQIIRLARMMAGSAKGE